MFGFGPAETLLAAFCLAVVVLARSKLSGRYGSLTRGVAQAILVLLIIGLPVSYLYLHSQVEEAKREHQEALRRTAQEKEAEDKALNDMVAELKKPLTLAAGFAWKTAPPPYPTFMKRVPVYFDDPKDIEFVGEALRETIEKANPDTKLLSEAFFTMFWQRLIESHGKRAESWDTIRLTGTLGLADSLKAELKDKWVLALAKNTPQALKKAREEIAAYETTLSTLKRQKKDDRKASLAGIKDDTQRAILRDHLAAFDRARGAEKE